MAGKTGTIVAVLAGAAIGAGLGILFAPDEGTKTRRKIKEGYGTKRDELKDKLSELTEQVKSRFGTSRADLESSLDHLVTSVEEKKDDIIATLERKLEQLKSESARNAGKTAAAGSQGGSGSQGAKNG